jgi:3-hydroxyacyl-[acyl-carrier-protein] dehydratase
MTAPPLNYPIELDAAAIQEVLPHRGDILFVQRVTVFAHDRYTGTARWSADLSILQGHFPGMPVVPGVLLIEAVAQVAGAGLLVGDAYARSMGENYVGLLAGIRKCSFKRPVLPGDAVEISVGTRQMTDVAALVTGVLRVGDDEVGSVEILVVNTQRSALHGHLSHLTEGPP